MEQDRTQIAESLTQFSYVSMIKCGSLAIARFCFQGRILPLGKEIRYHKHLPSIHFTWLKFCQRLRGIPAKTTTKTAIFQVGSCFTETAQRNQLGFRLYIPTVGNFTATSQRPIPPGLTISPQADTARPAAKRSIWYMQHKYKEFEQNKSKSYPPSADVPYILALKGEVLRNVG